MNLAMQEWKNKQTHSNVSARHQFLRIPELKLKLKFIFTVDHILTVYMDL